MRPLTPDDPFIAALSDAVSHLTSPTPSALELTALCNTALKLCVSRYENEPIFTTLLLCDASMKWADDGLLPFPARLDWRALARGFPDGVATRLERGQLRAFAGVTSTATEWNGVMRAMVLPGVVGLMLGGELLAELRPGQSMELLAQPRPSLESLLLVAGLPSESPLRATHLRRLLRTARLHRHGASLVITSASGGAPVDAPPLSGTAVAWGQFRDALTANPAEADRLADVLGRLSAVDGAMLIHHSGELLGFGLRLSAAPNPAVTVLYSERIGEPPEAKEEGPSTGSRRRSAVDFVTAHPDCFAMVLSSDGPLSLSWRQDATTVVVQRGVECLL